MWEIPNEVHQELHYLKHKHGTIVCNNSVVYSPQLEHAMPLNPTVAVLVGVGGGAPKDQKKKMMRKFLERVDRGEAQSSQ